MSGVTPRSCWYRQLMRKKLCDSQASLTELRLRVFGDFIEVNHGLHRTFAKNWLTDDGARP